MTERKFDIYITGVGGQGIGLFSEALIRAADHAGLVGGGVDTHGLAQRGGAVVSHVRIGPAYSPLIRRGCADLAISLESYEALRALQEYLADAKTLLYYDVRWQPLSVRLGKESPLADDFIRQECLRRNIREIRVAPEPLPDSRMQNTVLLGYLAKEALIPGVGQQHYEAALNDLMQGSMLEQNLALLQKIASA